MCSNMDNVGFKVIIDDMNLIICTKQLSKEIEIDHLTFVADITMQLPYTRVMFIHMAIPANSSTIFLDNLFTGALPD